MEELDLDAILEKNPHLDAEAVKRRQKETADENARERRRPQGAPSSPFGRRSAKDSDKWSEDRGRNRPHYRAPISK